MNYFFHMFFFQLSLSSKGHFEFSQNICTHNTLEYSLKKNCSKNSFLPDDIITTSSDEIKSCHSLGKQIIFSFPKTLML